MDDLTISDLEGVHNLQTDAQSPQKCLTFEAMKQQKANFQRLSVPPAAVNFVSKRSKLQHQMSRLNVLGELIATSTTAETFFKKRKVD